MKIAILGYAGQGQSAYEYWNTDGNQLTICDRSKSIDLPDDADTQLGDDYLKDLGKFDLIVRTPALHPRDIIAANPEVDDLLDRITTNTNEFMRICPTKNIIGVTGTKGKGTTSTLIARMLESAGKRVHLGGNIGIPPLDMLKNDIKPDDWVVLELANFQLIDIKYSPPFAVCLMIEPEHMDWHKDVEEYVTAKKQLFRWQGTDDIAVYYGENEYSSEVAGTSPGNKIPYMHAPGATVFMGKVTIDGQTICKIDELKLLGKHNWQNVCAATTLVWQITQDSEALRKALKEFSGLPFRIELRKEVDQVRYFNDSFATAPGAAIAAIQSVPGQKVMIMGGYDRGLDLHELAEVIKKNHDEIRKVLLIGQSAERTATTLKEVGFDNFVINESKSMDTIVKAAHEMAQPGDAVVLSPAFASFDMFKNFEERGRRFNEAVDRL